MTKIAIIEDDIVLGLGAGIVGPQVPTNLAQLPVDQLRFDGTNVIDVSSTTHFYISSTGRKHTTDATGRQLLSCNWDDGLVFENGFWRVKTQDDIDRELIRQGEDRIDAIADQAYTKSVSRAARYERKGEQAKVYKEAGYPTPIDGDLFSFIKKESESRNITGAQMADLILLRAKQFSDYGSDIDTIRSDSSEDIKNAPDETSKRAAVDAAIVAAQEKTNDLLTLIAST